jgi:hypothetical protein
VQGQFTKRVGTADREMARSWASQRLRVPLTSLDHQPLVAELSRHNGKPLGLK